MQVEGYLFRIFPDGAPRWYAFWVRLSGTWSNPRDYVQIVVSYTNGDKIATTFEVSEVGSFDISIPFYPAVLYSPSGVAGFPSTIEVLDSSGRHLSSGQVQIIDIQHQMEYVRAYVSVPSDAEDVLFLCTPATLTTTAFPHFDGSVAYFPKYALDGVTDICQAAYTRGGAHYLATVDVQPESPSEITLEFQEVPSLEAYVVDHLRYEYLGNEYARDARYFAKVTQPTNEYTYKQAKALYESASGRYSEGDTAEDSSASLGVLVNAGTFFYPEPEYATATGLVQTVVRIGRAVGQFVSKVAKKPVEVKAGGFENVFTKRLYVASSAVAKAGARAVSKAVAYAGTRLRSVVRLAGSAFGKALAVGALILGVSGAIYGYERARYDPYYDAKLRFCKDLSELIESAPDPETREFYKRVYEANCKITEPQGTDIVGAITSILPLILLLAIVNIVGNLTKE